MASKFPNTCLVLGTIMFFTILNPTVLAHPSPQPSQGVIPFSSQSQPSKETQKCLSSLLNIPGCYEAIYWSFFTGQFKPIGHSCCKAIKEINKDCWSKLFPFNPVFPPFLQSFCGGSKGKLPSSLDAGRTKVPLPAGLWQWGPDAEKCWSSLKNIEGCVSAIYGALSGNGLSSIGNTCCKAINEIQYKCWLIMFPWNPFFPPLLQSFCSGGWA